MAAIHDNKPVCGSLTLARPIGLKRTISTANMITKKKHRCNQFPNRDDDINATIVQGLDPNITVEEAHAILKLQRKKNKSLFYPAGS